MYKRQKKLLRKIVNSSSELLAFLNRSYPSFVTKQAEKNLNGIIPVFCFHSVYEDSFRKQLVYLKQNNYHTITCDELYKAILGELSLPDRSVLLTFDDGLESVWSVAYPLLKRFDFKATAFIVPEYIIDTDTIYPNIDDINEQEATLDDLKKRKADKLFLTWGEVNHMFKNKVIDIESHTNQHQRHFINKNCINFYSPEIASNLYCFDRPFVLNNGSDYLLKEDEFGAPLYPSDSRMSGELRYFDNEALRLKCINFISQNGGIKFFEEKNWVDELMSYYARNVKNNNVQKYETRDEMYDQIKKDLAQSKKKIEENVEGKIVEHLCYPWGIGSKIAQKISKEVGYKTNFWVVKSGCRENEVGTDPYLITRLKDDYIHRLPGEGRISLFSIFKKKFNRRLSQDKIY